VTPRPSANQGRTLSGAAAAPRRDRVAACDRRLSAFLATTQHPAPAARVRLWRLRGLLPAPALTETAQARGGKRVLDWNGLDWEDAKLLGSELASRSASGRPLDTVAIQMFIAGHPVPPAAVRAAAVRTVEAAAAHIETAVAQALLAFPPPNDDPFDPAWEQAHALAQATPVPARRRNLQPTAPADGGPDSTSAMTLLALLMRGAQPDHAVPDDYAALLTLFGADGVLDPVADGVPPMLASADEVLPALTASSLPSVTAALTAMPDRDVPLARELLAALSTVLAAVPPEARHHLGLPRQFELWTEHAPQLACMLLGMAAVMIRDLGPAVFDTVAELAEAAGVALPRSYPARTSLQGD
jgi:hypothetical protein